MDNTNASNPTSKINPLAWVLALSVIAVLVSGAYFSTIHFESMRKRAQVMALEMSYQLSGQATYTNLEDLNHVLQPQGIASFTNTQKENSILIPLTNISKNLSQNNFADIEQSVSDLETQADPALKKEIEDFTNIMLSIQNLSVTKTGLTTEKADKKRELQALNDDYKLLQKELSDFFGLSANENPELKFYNEGVLSGLPYLTNLNDNIPDLPTLVETLTTNQAQIVFPENLSVDEQRTYFDEKINNLKDTAFNISLKQEGVTQRNTEIAQALKETEEKLDYELNQANVLIANLAFKYANASLTATL